MISYATANWMAIDFLSYGDIALNIAATNTISG